MQKIDTSAIQRFLEATKRASQARARDIRLELNDAATVAAEIGLLLARLAVLENTQATAVVTSTGTMDGGSLR